MSGVPVLLDTDLGSDVDDELALAPEPSEDVLEEELVTFPPPVVVPGMVPAKGAETLLA